MSAIAELAGFRAAVLLAAVPLAALAALAALGGCARPSSIRSPLASVSRAQAIRAAMRALASAEGVESPRAIAAAAPTDSICRARTLEARLRCHLHRSTATVSAVRRGAGWVLVVAMPELSDHLHRVRVHPRPRGPPLVEVESEN